MTARAVRRGPASHEAYAIEAEVRRRLGDVDDARVAQELERQAGACSPFAQGKLRKALVKRARALVNA